MHKELRHSYGRRDNPQPHLLAANVINICTYSLILFIFILIFIIIVFITDLSMSCMKSCSDIGTVKADSTARRSVKEINPSLCRSQAFNALFTFT